MDKNNDTSCEVMSLQSSNSSLSEVDMQLNNFIEEENTECIKNLENEIRPVKRLREEDENDWTTVDKNGKKIKEQDNKLEVYVSHKEKIPKQFALAKLFKECKIENINKVKYINPYKIRLNFGDEVSLKGMLSCKRLIDLGWKFQRAMEINFSYGVIKNVDLDIPESEILKSIKCPNSVELDSLIRLNRRSSEKEGWSPSEAVRLCFKGSYLPAYVIVDGLKLRVDAYVFPVTQCSRCWKMGHTLKRCPYSIIVCPKCGENHANCERKNFKCINCSGAHMALDRSCPVYLKEKKIRELMAEFNISYRKALTVYVPQKKLPQTEKENIPQLSNNTFQPLSVPGTSTSTTYAEVTRFNTNNKKDHPKRSYLPFSKPSSTNNKERDDVIFHTEFDNPHASSNTEKEPERERNINFSELLYRLKEIIFLNSDTVQTKFKNFVKCCIEWLILLTVDNISDWPLLKCILDLING